MESPVKPCLCVMSRNLSLSAVLLAMHAGWNIFWWPSQLWLGYDKQGQFLETYGLSEFFQRKKLYL